MTACYPSFLFSTLYQIYLLLLWLLLQVIIEHGDLICGILSKDTLGNKTGSLMHVIAAEFGYDTARDFYGNIQKVVNNFLMIEGHSIGIGDTIADTFTYNDIQKTIMQAKVGEASCAARIVLDTSVSVLTACKVNSSSFI